MARSDEYWDKRAIQRLTASEKQSEEYIARIAKMYDEAQRNIEREIENIYRNYSKATGMDVQSLKTLLTKTKTDKLWEELKRKGLDQYVKKNYKARITRLEQLQAQIYAKAKQVYPQERKAHTAHYKRVVSDTYYKSIYDVQMGTGMDFAFSRLDDNMVSRLLDERWSGKNYSQRIWGNTDLLAESLSEIIGGAMLSGQSIAKTSRQVRERFDVAKYYADRLVRTETNHFNNEADAMAYEEMGLDQYVFMATLDTRTSTKCQDMDGEVIPLKEREVGKNFPPLHPNCRSKTRAYMGEEIEKTLKRRARNPATGKNEIVGNISYKEWAKQNGLDKPAPKAKHSSKPLTNKANNGKISSNIYGFDLIKGSHTIDDDIITAGKPTCNPKYGTDYQYNVNCQRCVQAYEYRRRGFDVVAKPKPKTNNTISWGNECFVDANGNTPKYTFNQTASQVKREILNAPDGARYSVYIKWKGYRSAHVFIAEKANGAVRYLDPQVGNLDAANYFIRGSKGRFGYLRMDDKQLTTDAKKVAETMERRT